MANEGSLSIPEILHQPVEIKFGDVVRIIEIGGEQSAESYVVTDPYSAEYIYAAHILDDSDDAARLATPGSYSQPLSVEGSWPLGKIIAATVRNTVIGRESDEVYINGMKEIVSRHYASAAQKPSVQYRGDPAKNETLKP